MPSKTPRQSSIFTRAVAQLELYLLLADRHADFLAETQALQVCLPRGIIVAGRDVNLANSDELRFLKHSLPSRISLLTWSSIIRRAERMSAERAVISLPSPVSMKFAEEYKGPLALGVVESLHSWTGFRTKYSRPTSNWRRLLEEADAKVAHYEKETDIHEHDEAWKFYTKFRGQTLGDAYYRLGKYCLTQEEFDYLQGVLPERGRTGRGFGAIPVRERLVHGFEDAKEFRKEGALAHSANGLKQRIDKVLATRGYLREPEEYYRRVMTMGYLDANVFAGDLGAIMHAAGWRVIPKIS